MILVFQMEARHDTSREAAERLLADLTDDGVQPQPGDRRYIFDTFETLCEHLEEIDARIDAHSPRWKVRRMPKADLAILRLAVCEGLYCDDIPTAVAINEALELAKRYGEEQTAPFIHAVAGAVCKAGREGR